MSLGLIAAVIVLIVFAVWGVVLLRSKITEKSTEAFSHHESDAGMGGPGPD